MSDTVRIAAVQMRSGTEETANLDAIADAVATAAGDGASYVLTPEVSVVFAENSQQLAGRASSWEGNPAIGRCAAIARANGVFLHLGSLAIALDDGRFANRSVLFSPAGDVIAHYDKIHLFDATLPGLKHYRESATYRGGTEAVVTDAPGFALGMSICYDLRFGPLFGALARAGAQVLAVPAAFTVPTGQAHWEVLLRARAIETGCFVVAAAQGGAHQNGRATYGHSMVVGPWGEVIGRLDHDEPGVLVADIDLARVAEARGKVPALDNARPFSISVTDGSHSANVNHVPLSLRQEG